MLAKKHRGGGKLQEGLAVGSDISMAAISRSLVHQIPPLRAGDCAVRGMQVH